MEDINFFAKTNFRNAQKKFGIRLDDRRRHTYVIGKTGVGKTSLLSNMLVQDVEQGMGVGFVDPHGEAAEDLLDFVPKERIKDVIYFNPADIDWPICFNVMEDVDASHRHLVASGLMGVFKKIWPDVWSARMEYILNNSILALLECPGTTLLGINRLLSDPDYRDRVLKCVKDPVVKSFWTQEYARYSQRYETEATAAIQNKIGQFISAPLIRNIIGQKTSSVDMRSIMDGKKILILNLSKGRIGEDASRLLGGLLITKLQLAAMSRVDIKEEERKDFFLYVDEFQNFATESFANILSEARKYRLDLILAHQYVAQMEDTVREAVFGNVGTLIVFRVGAEDAEFLEKEFQPEFLVEDLVNLPKHTIYLKLLIDGITSRPFSAITLFPATKPSISYRKEIIENSRKMYASKRSEVESAITSWTLDYVEHVPEKTSQQAEMYDVVCQKCGKQAKVPFKPDKTRPVFCKACKKILDEEKKNAVTTPQPVPQPQPQPQPVAPQPSKPLQPQIQPAAKAGQIEQTVISLSELLNNTTVSFKKGSVKKPNPKPQVDHENLKKLIQSSQDEQAENNRTSGKIEEGQRVKL